MERQYLLARGAEVLGQALAKVYRPVAAAGAADADRDIGTVVGLEARQPGVEERAHVGEEAADLRFGLEPRAHRAVAPGQRPQLRVPMRIRQAARVEQEIRI